MRGKQKIVRRRDLQHEPRCKSRNVVVSSVFSRMQTSRVSRYPSNVRTSQDKSCQQPTRRTFLILSLFFCKAAMCWGVIGGMIVSRCLVVVKRKTCLLIVSIEAWHIEAWHETIVCIISHVSNKTALTNKWNIHGA